jgi:hypothetical protein
LYPSINDWEEISFVVGGGLHRGNTPLPKILRARVVICNQPETGVSFASQNFFIFSSLQ